MYQRRTRARHPLDPLAMFRDQRVPFGLTEPLGRLVEHVKFALRPRGEIVPADRAKPARIHHGPKAQVAPQAVVVVREPVSYSLLKPPTLSPRVCVSLPLVYT